MDKHASLPPIKLHALIRAGSITLGGNKLLKIYGTLSCTSGKRMNAKNRVFFKNEGEALDLGFRPCGNCMRDAFNNWKLRKKQVE